MKKRMVLLTAFTLVALLVAGGTMAWFTSEAKVTNTFTAGTVEIEIDEHGFQPITNVNPGDCFEKKITIKSTGSKRTLVRVKLVEEWKNVKNNASTNGVASYSVNHGLFKDWLKVGDWYYYKKELNNEHRETSLLLNNTKTIFGCKGKEICFPGKKMGNDFQGATFNLIVEAEAIQATNGAPVAVWALGLDSLQQIQGYESMTEAEFNEILGVDFETE